MILWVSLALATPALVARPGPDGTVELSDGQLGRRYDAEGDLLLTFPPFAGPTRTRGDARAEAEADGVWATLVDDTLRVGRCAHRVTGPTRASGSPPGDNPGRPWGIVPPPPTRLAISADWVVLSGPPGVLVVDRHTCAVVATRAVDEGPRAEAMYVAGAELVMGVTTTDRGFEVSRWALPSLAPLGGFDTRTAWLLPTAEGPARLSLGATASSPWRTAHLRPPTGPGVRLDGEVQAIDAGVVHLLPDGALRLLDAAGVVRGGTAPGTLQGLWTVDQGAGEVWVGDGAGVVHLPEGSIGPPAIPWADAAADEAERVRGRPGVAFPVVDEPDRRDVLADRPVPTAAEPVIARSADGAWLVRRQGDHAVVTGSGQQWGVALPARTLAVSADGAVSVDWASGVGLRARRVADGVELWRRPASVARPVVIGPDWIAVAETGWTFLDPADGALVARLDPTGTLIVGDARLPFDAARVRRAPWNAPPPAGRPYVPVSAVDPPLLALEPACADPTAALVLLTPFPDVYRAESARLVARCTPRPPAALPPWPEAAQPVADGSWRVRLPEEIRGAEAVGQGRLYVRTTERHGVFGPDGRLLWVAPVAGEGMVGGDSVQAGDGRRVQRRDLATGETRGTRAGEVVPGGVRLTRYGRVTPVAGAAPPAVRAWSWVCGEGHCFPAWGRVERAARVDGTWVETRARTVRFLPPGGPPRVRRGFDHVRVAEEGLLLRRRRDGVWVRADTRGQLGEVLGRAEQISADPTAWWASDRRTITAHGLPAPAAPAGARVFVPPGRTAPVWPPERAAPPERPPANHLVDVPAGVEARRGDAPVWTAAEVRAVGVVAGVAVLRGPDGSLEGRTLEDGHPLWRRAEGGTAARVVRGGLFVGERPWTLLDEHTGVPIGTGMDMPLAVGRDGDRTALAHATREGARVVTSDGAVLVEALDLPMGIALVGPDLVVLTEGGVCLGYRDGEIRWVLRRGRVTALGRDAEGVWVRLAEWTLHLDPATGAVRGVAPAPDRGTPAR